MSLEEFAELVRRMRAKQKEYFKKRTPTLLAESKDWERRVDEALDVLAGKGTPSMFDGPKGGA